MTVDASELKHGKSTEFAGEIFGNNDWEQPQQQYDPWGNPIVNPMMMGQPIVNPNLPYIHTNPMIASQGQQQAITSDDVGKFEATPPSFSPNSPDYDPHKPPPFSPNSPDYDSNKPPEVDSKGNPVIKIKTIAEEKKDKDKEVMPLLNAVEDKTDNENYDGDFDIFQKDGSIKKIN